MSSSQDGRGFPTSTPGGSAGRGASRAMAVLFVDADLESARRLAHAIEGRALVAVVGSMREAWSAIQVRIPDLVVTEMDLPDGSGLELLANLRRLDATRHVLLMVVTRRRAVADKIAAFQVGADDCLVKPVEPAVFATHVNLVSRFRKILP